MNRDEKASAVADLSNLLEEAQAIFAIDYRGIGVAASAELRRKLSEADASFRVVKNRLAKRAASAAGLEEIDGFLTGPTALTLVRGDAVIAAKAISTFAREHEVLEYKGGLMDGQALDPDGFKAIARLPGRDVLHGQLVGIAASPITGLARGLGAMLSGLAVALGQIQERGLVGADEPAAEAPTEPAEEQTGEAAAAGGGGEKPSGEAEDGDDESSGASDDSGAAESEESSG